MLANYEVGYERFERPTDYDGGCFQRTSSLSFFQLVPHYVTLKAFSVKMGLEENVKWERKLWINWKCEVLDDCLFFALSLYHFCHCIYYFINLESAFFWAYYIIDFDVKYSGTFDPLDVGLSRTWQVEDDPEKSSGV